MAIFMVVFAIIIFIVVGAGVKNYMDGFLAMVLRYCSVFFNIIIRFIDMHSYIETVIAL